MVIGEDFDFKLMCNKVILVVNVVSVCGFMMKNYVDFVFLQD